jgi:dolichyl-phosphate beta-glucosyltransferase
VPVQPAAAHEDLPDLSIVIPAYREADLIVASLTAVADYLATCALESVEVIVVVADSSDATMALALDCAGRFPSVRVVAAGPRAGKGRDVRLGMLTARGRYRLFMDADLATPLHHLDALPSFMHDDADVVIAVRDLWHIHPGWTRRLITTVGNLLARVVLLPGIKDTQCGFKLFRADVCDAVFSQVVIDGWGFDLEALAVARRMGYRIDVLDVPDWSDPKATRDGLGHDHAGSAAARVLVDLARIRGRLWRGRYASSAPQRSGAPMQVSSR